MKDIVAETGNKPKKKFKLVHPFPHILCLGTLKKENENTESMSEIMVRNYMIVFADLCDKIDAFLMGVIYCIGER